MDNDDCAMGLFSQKQLPGDLCVDGIRERSLVSLQADHESYSLQVILAATYRLTSFYSKLAGISRVCTGFSNNPDIVRYTPFLPLMRRTISLRITWGELDHLGFPPFTHDLCALYCAYGFAATLGKFAQ